MIALRVTFSDWISLALYNLPYGMYTTELITSSTSEVYQSD